MGGTPLSVELPEVLVGGQSIYFCHHLHGGHPHHHHVQHHLHGGHHYHHHFFFFIFISTPEGHERGTFWRIIISFQSGTENIDYSSLNTCTCSAALQHWTCSSSRDPEPRPSPESSNRPGLGLMSAPIREPDLVFG